MYPLVRELAADGIPVAVTCRVLKIARQPYYRWLANPVTDAELERGVPGQRAVRRPPRRPGVRLPVPRRRGPRRRPRRWPTGRRGGSARTTAGGRAFGKKRGKNGKKPGPPVHDDLVERDFTADAPNQLWLADITEHRTGEGKLYLCAIKDVYSNRIVGYSIDSRMKSRLAVAALNNAVARRGDVAGCVLHTDRGSPVPLQEVRPRAAPPRHGRLDGPGRRGRRQRRHGVASSRCCRRTSSTAARWDTREELRIAIVTWIERTYHRRRRQAALGRLTPVEYEMIMTTPATQAA